MLISKRDIKSMMKSSAKIQGISLKEFREKIQENIYAMKESDDPEVQKNYKKLFRNKAPTPEEYFYKMTKAVTKKMKF